tara:strand:- start:2857 stop:3699 length:843 start_codon:yes stop_codon:yes gene_type:complete
MKNVSNTTTTNNEFKAEFKELWDSSVVEDVKDEMRKERDEFAKANNFDDGQITQTGGCYIVCDEVKGERAIDEPFYFKDYVTRKHTYEVFVEAKKLGLEHFSIIFQWDLQYWEEHSYKFRGEDPEHSGGGDAVQLITYGDADELEQILKDEKIKRQEARKVFEAKEEEKRKEKEERERKIKEALTRNTSYVPTSIQGLFTYKAYGMLIAIGKYSTNNNTKGRAIYYLMDNDSEIKKNSIEFEGGFMSAVLRGDLLLALRRADECNYEALCKALTNRELDI